MAETIVSPGVLAIENDQSFVTQQPVQAGAAIIGPTVKGKDIDFALFFNSRNIRRKQIPDAMFAYKIFIDSLTEEQAKKCAFVLHTQVVDAYEKYKMLDVLTK